MHGMTVCSGPQLQRPHVRVSASRNISETLQAWFFKVTFDGRGFRTLPGATFFTTSHPGRSGLKFEAGANCGMVAAAARRSWLAIFDSIEILLGPDS